MNIFIGCGGCLLDALAFLLPRDVILIDDYKTGLVEGYKIYGTVDDLISGKIKVCSDDNIYNTIGSEGNNQLRNNIYEKIRKAGLMIRPLIMGKISKNVYIGENVFVNLGAQIHHNCHIGNNCVVSPGAILCGNVRLENNVFVGAGAILIQDIIANANSVIGAGSVCINNNKIIKLLILWF